jgi:hypothetical protein
MRVNSIAPGPVDTQMARGEHRSETRVMSEKMIPMHCYAGAEEMASAALFPASDGSSYVSGSIVTADRAYSGAGNMGWPGETYGAGEARLSATGPRPDTNDRCTMQDGSRYSFIIIERPVDLGLDEFSARLRRPAELG